MPGHRRGVLAARTGQQDLATPQGERSRGAQPGFQLLACLGG